MSLKKDDVGEITGSCLQWSHKSLWQVSEQLINYNDDYFEYQLHISCNFVPKLWCELKANTNGLRSNIRSFWTWERNNYFDYCSDMQFLEISISYMIYLTVLAARNLNLRSSNLLATDFQDFKTYSFSYKGSILCEIMHIEKWKVGPPTINDKQ